MTEHEPIRRRWAEEKPADPAARQLAETLRPTLSAAQLTRVEARLAASIRATSAASFSPGSRRRAGVLLAATALTAGLVLGFFGRAVLRPERPAAESLPPSVSSRNLPVQIALLGTGEVSPTGPESPLQLRRGGLLLRTGETPVVVQCQSTTIKVSPHSLVEVVSAYQGSPLVAAYLGSAAVRWPATEREVTLTSGQAATSRGPVALPEGRSERAGTFRFDSEPAGSPALPPLNDVLDSKPQLPPEPQPAPEPQTSSLSQSANGTNRLSARPMITPPPPSPVSAGARDSDALLSESQLLNAAMARLRTAQDPSGALVLLEAYSAQFPQGNLRQEAELLRMNVLLALGRKQEALLGLDAQTLAEGTPRAPEQRVVRGELRADTGRCREAVADFDSVLGQAQGELAERALYGRSRCLAQLGEVGLARNGLAEYLRRFPNGRFSSAARKLFLAAPESPHPLRQDR